MDEPSTFDLPPPSAETLRRRQQSDLASQRIAQKMLQGFAMLGEECLNDECFGVPLIRPPRRDGTKDPRKVSPTFRAAVGVGGRSLNTSFLVCFTGMRHMRERVHGNS